MGRKNAAVKRKVIPDPKFNDIVVAKAINTIMRDGKKPTAERILYSAFDILQEKTNDDPIKIFKKALDNLKPMVEVKSRRVGGATYQVPIEVKPDRRQALALRWLMEYASSRPGTAMNQKLAEEILDALANRGGAVKKREDVHRMAEANKAFSRYRW